MVVKVRILSVCQVYGIVKNCIFSYIIGAVSTSLKECDDLKGQSYRVKLSRKFLQIAHISLYFFIASLSNKEAFGFYFMGVLYDELMNRRKKWLIKS